MEILPKICTSMGVAMKQGETGGLIWKHKFCLWFRSLFLQVPLPPAADVYLSSIQGGEVMDEQDQTGQFPVPLAYLETRMTHQSGAENPVQRRGRKNYFQGSRIEYLKSHIPEYRSHKKGNRERFWSALFSGWWQRYPWGLDDHEEPPTDDPEKMRRLASVTPDEVALKAEVERRLTAVRCVPTLHYILN